MDTLDDLIGEIDVPIEYNTLYKLDNKGAMRTWWVEQIGDRYRTHSGILGMAIVTSEWTTCKPTNVGKANERNGVSQCRFEINSLYEDKRTSGGYHKDAKSALTEERFEPMLAKAWVKDFKPKVQDEILAAGCYAQPKLDGVRCNVSYSKELQSREHKPIVAVPHIWEVLAPILETVNVIVDGELYNHEYHDDFNKLISLIRKSKPSDLDLEESRMKVQYWIYDAFFPDEPGLVFQKRFERLTELFGKLPFIQIVPTTSISSREELDEHYGQILEDNYEGQIIRVNAPYEQKRSKTLIKRKEFFDEEFRIVDIHEGNGNWSGYAKAIEFQALPGRTAKCGIKGERGDFARDLLINKEKYKGGTVTVRWPNKTPDGVPRFGVAYAVYEGDRDM